MASFKSLWVAADRRPGSCSRRIAAVKHASITLPTPRISVPLYIVICRYCFFRGINPGYGGKLLYISSKTASLLCFPKKPFIHSIIFFGTSRKMLCSMSARTIAGGWTLGMLHKAFWIGLTSSWANLFWHIRVGCLVSRSKNIYDLRLILTGLSKTLIGRMIALIIRPFWQQSTLISACHTDCTLVYFDAKNIHILHVVRKPGWQNWDTTPDIFIPTNHLRSAGLLLVSIGPERLQNGFSPQRFGLMGLISVQ